MRRFVLTSYRKLFRKMSIFTQKFDPITGLTAWEMQDPDYDYHQEVGRSAFADMLHDHERNEKYYIALKAAIDKKHSEGQKANVLDIGTGTGLLSMMAAKCGADTIIACEAFKPMANCAAKIIEENGFGSAIKLVRKRSTELTVGEKGDMPIRANILVTEVFDTELIGEGALSTFRHAHEDLLEKDSLVVPSSGTIWVQLVESDRVRAWNRINPLIDPDSSRKLIVPPENINVCPGASAVHDIQLTQLPRKSFTPLMPARAIFRFDWTGKKPLIFEETATIREKVVANGTAHAIFMWWDLTMDHEDKVLLSCAPVWEHPDGKEYTNKGHSLEEASEKIPWRDHWMQAVYYLPIERSVEINEELTLVGSHDEYSFSFAIEDKSKSSNGQICVSKVDPPICDCYLHLAYSRTRIGQLNDAKRNEKYLRILKERINRDTVCLCLSDGSILGLTAVSFGAKKVIVIEPSCLSRRTLENFVETNGLENRVSVIESIDDLPNHEKPNLVFGDPYYVTSILPWDNLRFWYLATRSAPNIPRIPAAARIRAVAVQFKDLHKIRSPLGVCEGFDLTTFDKFIQTSSEISDSPVEAQPLWEYPGIALSPPFDLVHFDLSQDLMENRKTNYTGKVPFVVRGSCNGIAIWIDWYLDEETIVSTGPTREIVPGEKISWDFYTRQGVFLPRNIIEIDETSVINWTFSHRIEETWQCFDFHVTS